MIGTFINVIAVIAGGSIGLLFNTKLPDKFIKIVFQAIGLFTLFIGFYMAFKTTSLIIMVGSIVLGSVIGELLKLDKHFDSLGNYLNKITKSKNSRFTEAFTTAFVLYCMGSMTILGAFQEGTGGKPEILFTKSLMDGLSSIALASALGIGVLFSIVPLFIYQGSLTFIAKLFDTQTNEIIIDELTAVGGLLLIGLGISILEIKKINTINMLPALVVVVILAKLFL